MFEALFVLGTLTIGANARLFGFGLGLSDVLYAMALVTLVVTGIAKNKPVREWLPGHLFWITAILVLTGGLLATFASNAQAVSLVATLKTFYLFSFWMAMGIVMTAERKREKWVLLAFIAAALFTALVAIWDKLTGSLWGPAIGSALGNVLPGIGYSALALVYGRYTGIMGHPNIQSEFLLVVTPIVMNFAWYDWKTTRRLYALAWVVVLLVLVYAIYLTGSVTGLLCVAGAFGVFALAASYRIIVRWFIPMFLVSAALVVCGLGLILVNDADYLAPVLARLSTDPNFNRAITDTSQGRIELALETGELILENPIVGYGLDLTELDKSLVATAANGGVHNALLRSWFTGGILVFAGILYAYWRALRLTWYAVKRQLAGFRDEYIFGLGVSILVWSLNDMFQPSFSQRFTWLTAALLYGIVLRQARAKFSAPREQITRGASRSVEQIQPAADGFAE